MYRCKGWSSIRSRNLTDIHFGVQYQLQVQTECTICCLWHDTHLLHFEDQMRQVVHSLVNWENIHKCRQTLAFQIYLSAIQGRRMLLLTFQIEQAARRSRCTRSTEEIEQIRLLFEKNALSSAKKNFVSAQSLIEAAATMCTWLQVIRVVPYGLLQWVGC